MSEPTQSHLLAPANTTNITSTPIDHDEKSHQGHEIVYVAINIVFVTAMIVSQILLILWNISKYQRLYVHASMILMYLIPFCISVYSLCWRFVSIWVIISLVTVVLVWRPLFMPNFAGSGSAIPRLLYKWFFIVYTLSSIVAVTGCAILVLTMIVITLPNSSPELATETGFIMLFYGIYYGVLCRDFTDFLVDRLAAQIGYYNPNSAMPSKLLRNNICAICGMEHGDREDIDLEGLTKNGTLLGDNSHPDLEILLDLRHNTMKKERLFVLTCGHKFHEFCIYGWCLVGKRQVCPFCREKVDLGRMFSALPFQKPHYLYGNFLDFIRYLFAWIPLLILATIFINYVES